MISNGEVIESIYSTDELTAVMLGEDWWENPRYDHTNFWDTTYPNRYKQVNHNIYISAGEVITAAEKMDDLLEVMTGSRFGYDPNSPLWDEKELCRECECFLSTNESEICTDCESSRTEYGDEPDVDEAQEWHDFDPEC